MFFLVQGKMSPKPKNKKRGEEKRENKSVFGDAYYEIAPCLCVLSILLF